MNKALSPLKAIRRHCLTCAGRPKEVRECESAECALFPYRMGRNPFRAGIGVGIRAQNGQFQGKIARPAGASQAIKASSDTDKDKAASGNLEAINTGIKVASKGKIEIEELNKTIVIKLTKD